MLAYPFESHFASGLHGHKGAVALALLVAHNVDLSKAVGAHEAVVKVIGLPPDGRGNGGLVLERSVPALVCHAVGDDFVDVPVGRNKSGKSDGCDEGLHDGRWER